MNRNYLKGLLLVLGSLLSFGIMMIFSARTSSAVSLSLQVFMRNLIGFLAAAFMCRKASVPILGKKSSVPLLFARSAAAVICIYLLFYAGKHTSQSNIAIVYRTSMFTVALVSVKVLHERLTRMHVPAMVLAFAGVIIGANPRLDASLLPLLCVFLAMLCDTVSAPVLRLLADKEDSRTVVAFMSGFCALVSFAGLLMHPVLPHGADVFYLIGIGVTALAGQLFMTRSYAYLGAAEISIYNQFGIVVNTILGFLFLGQRPGWNTFVGGGIVLLASLLLYLARTRDLEKEAGRNR